MKQIFVLLSMLFVLSCSKKEEFLVLGTNNDFPPFVYIIGDDPNDVMGFDIELAKEIAKDQQKTLKINVMNFNDILPALENDEIDMAINGITITPQRKLAVDFSSAYYRTSQTILIRKNDLSFVNIKNTNDLILNDKKIASQRGTTGSSIATEISGNKAITNINSWELILMELVSENIDAIIVDKDTARSFTNKYKNLVILPMEFNVEHYGVAVQKNNKELLTSVNYTLDRLINSGEYMNMVEKYIHQYKF